MMYRCQLIEWLSRNLPQSDKLAYFYCSKSNQQRQDPVDVVRSLLRQLALNSNSSALPKVVDEEYKRREEDGSLEESLSGEQWCKILNGVVEVLPRVVIVIDALDQCSNFYRLLSLLKSVVSTQRHLKVILAG